VAFDHTSAVTGVDEATERVVFGGQEPSPKVEYWTLSRPTGAQTPDLESGAQCPSCGAPVDRSKGPVCPYCRAELPSAMLGWVLDRVDDEIEWAQVPYQESPDDERRRAQERADDDWLDAQLRNTRF
jgi:hypothetical protein